MYIFAYVQAHIWITHIHNCVRLYLSMLRVWRWGQLWELFCQVGPKDWTQVTRRGGKCLYPLSNFAGPTLVLFKSPLTSSTSSLSSLLSIVCVCMHIVHTCSCGHVHVVDKCVCTHMEARCQHQESSSINLQRAFWVRTSHCSTELKSLTGAGSFSRTGWPVNFRYLSV